MPAQTPDLTVAVQDYLKAIYALESAGERVTTSALAERMGVSAPSATAMTKRLAELGLVEREPYRGGVLTANGRRAALEVLGFPTHYPHGVPIPSRELELPAVDDRTLESLEPGERTTVTRVPDRDAD